MRKVSAIVIWIESPGKNRPSIIIRRLVLREDAIVSGGKETE